MELQKRKSVFRGLFSRKRFKKSLSRIFRRSSGDEAPLTPKRLEFDKNARVVAQAGLRSRIDQQPVNLQPPDHEFSGSNLDIHWVMPDFKAGGGGHMTIFRIVRLLEMFGHRITIWLYRRVYHEDGEQAYNDIVKHFQPVSAQVKFYDEGLSESVGDVVIATDWPSVNYVNSMKHFKRRFYFVQDDEPQFFPEGSHRLSAARTYNDDLDCICASPWLKQVISERHGRWAREFWLGVDKNTYNIQSPPQGMSSKMKIAFYARKVSARRAVELGFLAFEDLARRGVEFELHCFGGNLDFKSAPFDCVDHGKLAPEQLAELYRSCDMGVVFSATNYSLVPQEMMACGLAVAELESECTRVVFPSDVVTLVSPDPRQMSTQLEALIQDKPRRESQAKHALKWVSQFEWEDAARTVESSIKERLTELGFSDITMKINSPSTAKSSGIKASIVIPTLDGGKKFGRVLNALCTQRTPWPFEILVVDSGSTDGTVEMLNKFPDIRLHQIDKSEFQHGRTRNLAICLTSGEYVALITQDALPKNDEWLYRLVAALENYPNAAGAFGRHEAWPDADEFTKRDIEKHFARFDQLPVCVSKDTDRARWQSKDTIWRRLLHFYSDNNSCLRRSIWERHRYPEIEFGEDQVWAQQILEAGFQKLYVRDAVVFHSHDFDEVQAEERAATEATFFRDHFGYDLVANHAVSKRINALNEADRAYAKKYRIDSATLSRRETLNKARISGYAREKFGR